MNTRGVQWPEKTDLVVVGGGTAGIVAAKTAAGFGREVVLVERERTGGDCLWTGCVPSKALLAAASVAATVRSASRFGIDTEPPRVDFARVMQHVHSAIAEIAPVDSPEALAEAGVQVIDADAVFTGPNTVLVGTRTLRFGQAIVTTGAHPTVPAIEGIEHVDYLTSDTVWDLKDLPQRLLIVGAGSVGCEMAQAFSRLGSEVTLVGRSATIAPREDASATAILTRALTNEGVRVLTSAAVVRIEDGSAVTDTGIELGFDRVLVATGRTPRTASLGLESAGVGLDDNGFVRVDEQLRTTNPRIWAAGDLTGHPQFTHTAGVHGSLAASNAALGLGRKASTTGTPRVIFTDPEIASAGIDVRTARQRGLRLQTLDHRHLDRAVTEGATNGSTTLVLDGKRRILGACVVGPRAGETIGELIIAVEQGLRTRDLAGATHPYPTYNDGPWNAAIADVKAQLSSPVISRALAALATVRGTWILRKARDTRR